MTSPAQTVRIFGVYLIALAAVLVVAPNLLLQAFGMGPVTDVWIRLSVFLFFGAFVLLKLAPPVLLVFAIVDAAAAIWTWMALKRTR